MCHAVTYSPLSCCHIYYGCLSLLSLFQVVCTVIAVALHYFFLVAFFIMLAQGILAFTMAALVFRHRRANVPMLMIMGWGK